MLTNLQKMINDDGYFITNQVITIHRVLFSIHMYSHLDQAHRKTNTVLSLAAPVTGSSRVFAADVGGLGGVSRAALVCSQLMWADVAVCHVLSTADVFKLQEHGYELSAYPKLQALRDKFESTSSIAAWMKARPDTQF